MLGLGAAALLGALSLAPDAPTPGIPIEWSAPSQCPAPSQVQRWLTDALADSAADPAGIMARVEIAAVPGGFQLELALDRPEGPVGRRTMNAIDCHALATAAVLIIALTVDPQAKVEVSDLGKGPEPEPEFPEPVPVVPVEPEPEPEPEVRPEAEPEPAPEVVSAPSPPERLLEAVRSELRLVRNAGDASVTDAMLDRVRVGQTSHVALAEYVEGTVNLSPDHVVLRRALDAGIETPDAARWVSILASAAYTALNHWLDEVTDEDEGRFHRLHARHLSG